MRPFSMPADDEVEQPVRHLFEELEKSIGFVPNVYRVSALSTPAMIAFFSMKERFGDCGLSPRERTVVQMAVSHFNGCGYCIAGHSMLADDQGFSATDLHAMRNGLPLEEPRLEALRVFTEQLMRSRGSVSQRDLVLFFEAGFTPVHVVDVILGVSLKTFSNFLSSAVNLPLDEAFEPYRWTKENTQVLKVVTPARG